MSLKIGNFFLINLIFFISIYFDQTLYRNPLYFTLQKLPRRHCQAHKTYFSPIHLVLDISKYQNNKNKIQVQWFWTTLRSIYGPRNQGSLRGIARPTELILFQFIQFYIFLKYLKLKKNLGLVVQDHFEGNLCP